MPSWREGLSRSLIEAAAMEKAIITTNVPGCRDVVENGTSGLLVPVRDIEALELSIEFLLNNRQLIPKLGRNARQRVLMEFRVEKVNQGTLEQYDALLSS